MIKKLVTFLILFSILGCDSDATGVGSEVVGIYQLTAVNGEPLPQAAFPFLSDVVRGSLTLQEDGTFIRRTVEEYENWQTGEITEEVETETGTYSRSGKRMTFTVPEGTVRGNYADDTIIIDAILVEYTYGR